MSSYKSVQKQMPHFPSPKRPKIGGIRIVGTGQYQQVPFDSIEIAERPEPGKEADRLFFNPRSSESFSEKEMAPLRRSIQLDGLQQPPTVRAYLDKDGVTVTRVELIAGERRIRCIRQILDGDLPCFDENFKPAGRFESGDVVIAKGKIGTVVSYQSDVFLEFEDGTFADVHPEDVTPTRRASQVYNELSCKVMYDCSDAKALRLAFLENDQRTPITTGAEIALVERLIRRGLRQEQIAEMLHNNITWVSQTGAFRHQLPPQAFDKLVCGTMSRNVAVKLLSYEPDQRLRLFQEAEQMMVVELRQELVELKDKQEVLEDTAEIHKDNAARAEREGDAARAEREAKKAEANEAKAAALREKVEDKRSARPTLKAGHIRKASQKTGIAPKKGTMLERDDLELMISQINLISVDEISSGEAALIRLTLTAVISGQRDVLAICRQYRVAEEVEPAAA